jgi:hypothetical protein
LASTQELENKILREAASKYHVDLTFLTQRVTDVAATLKQVMQAKPDGLIVVAADFDVGRAGLRRVGARLGKTPPRVAKADAPARLQWCDRAGPAVRRRRHPWELAGVPGPLEARRADPDGYYREAVIGLISRRSGFPA